MEKVLDVNDLALLEATELQKKLLRPLADKMKKLEVSYTKLSQISKIKSLKAVFEGEKRISLTDIAKLYVIMLEDRRSKNM